MTDAARIWREAEHQPRERAVPCQRCRRDTWNLTPICDACDGSSWAQAFDDAACPVCHGDRIIEEPVYGRFAVEATRPIHCSRCWDGKPVRSAS